MSTVAPPVLDPEIAPAGSTEAPPPARTVRDAAFDVVKGIAILEVMLHHSLSFSMSRFAPKWSTGWWVLADTITVIHVGVATFLFLAALMLARSIASRSRPDWRGYFSRRAIRAAWPYVLWTGLYLAARIWLLRSPADLAIVSVELGALRFDVPRILTPESLARFLFLGKASFHLYFLSVLLQFVIVFPLLYWVARRSRLGFGWGLAAACVLQAGVLLAQATWKFLPYPASTVVWYLVPFAGGIYIGLEWNRWGDLWRAWRIPMAVLAAGSLGLHIWVNNLVFAELPRSNFLFNASFVVYTFCASFLLLGFGRWLAERGRIARALAVAGERSMALYLIHPILFHFLGGPRVRGVLEWLPLTPLAVWLAIVLGTWAIVEATYRLRLSGLLYGRA